MSVPKLLGAMAVVAALGTSCDAVRSSNPADQASAESDGTRPSTASEQQGDAGATLSPFGVVELVPEFEVDGVGEDIDTIAFWEAPDPLDTLMFVTSKATAEVEVWKFPFVGGEQPPLRHETFGDSEVNGVVFDQSSGLLFVTASEPASALSVFQYPGADFVEEINAGRLDLAEEPSVEVYRDGSGLSRLFLTTDDEAHIIDAESKDLIGSFGIDADVETILADEFWERIYLPDEKNNRGIFIFSPEGVPSREIEDGLIGEDVFDEDAEGILLYAVAEPGGTDTGRGFIVASDQREEATEFEFFDRTTGIHLGSLRLQGVSNTDGIASTQRPLPGYPEGIFAAVNDDGSVVGIGWQLILETIGRP